jgi:putative intracellular protease/amidase
MSANISVMNPDKPKRILLVAAHPSVSKQTGWPIGVWAAELTHPYWEFTENGYQVDIISPKGGDL